VAASPPAPERRPAIERAVSELLRACGLELDHKDLVGTPARVARVWSEEFLSGFAMDPAQILGCFFTEPRAHLSGSHQIGEEHCGGGAAGPHGG